MGLFDDFSKFLENRLEEFLQNNPHLELQALEEKLREQEEETIRLMADLRLKEKQAQDEILSLAQEIQQWHFRIEKAKAAGRPDLVEPAQAREALLLRQGNQRWGTMEMIKERIKQTEELQRKIQARRQEVQSRYAEVQSSRARASAEQRSDSFGWSQTPSYIHGNVDHANADPLEHQFRRWEAEQELEQLKRNMGR